MIASARGLRVVAALLAAGLSMAAGFALIFRLFTPATVSSLPTPALLGVIGLLVLPPLTAWAFAAERRTVQRTRERARVASRVETYAIQPDEPPTLDLPEQVDHDGLELGQDSDRPIPGAEMELKPLGAARPGEDAQGRRVERHRRRGGTGVSRDDARRRN